MQVRSLSGKRITQGAITVTLIDGDNLAILTNAKHEALSVPPAQARQIIESSLPRPVTPVYTQLSEILQIHLHRALTGQREPEQALRGAAREMRDLLAKVGLSPGASGGDRDSG